MPANLADATVLIDDVTPVLTSTHQLLPGASHVLSPLLQRHRQAETDAQAGNAGPRLPEEPLLEVDNAPEVLLMSHDVSGTPIIMGTVS